ncbi:MAG: 1-deoxy-D-xylulose-5-phosphate reductoisomerase [Clostridia bacterium]|nr:1-deoxy-D-xylulose-5-phosphate reductoisomerase [Clostridia bacterium]
MTDKKIVILGSTGSVGQQTVEVAQDLGVNTVVLAAGRDYKKMEIQARQLRPLFCVMEDEAAARELKLALADTDIRVEGGHEALLSAAAYHDADVIFNSVGGSDGLEPTMAALEAGKTLALANKESIVMAGETVMKKARELGSRIIPVDSEHSAIFQCLEGRSGNDINRILLTASGGPFFGMSRDEMSDITPERALAHPTWKMGPKITIDSATLMNKGFEVIEAVHLFGVRPEQVEVVVHRESIIHSMVEYNDNAVLAQLSLPDMRLCAQYAMTYPERVPGIMGRLDLTALGKLTFYKPDYNSFPLLRLAYDSISQGGVIPAALVAADEEAVDAFMNKKIGFTSIYTVVSETLERIKNIKSPSLDDVSETAREAKQIAAELIKKF